MSVRSVDAKSVTLWTPLLEGDGWTSIKGQHLTTRGPQPIPTIDGPLHHVVESLNRIDVVKDQLALRISTLVTVSSDYLFASSLPSVGCPRVWKIDDR